jgi:hypothetical protein
MKWRYNLSVKHYFYDLKKVGIKHPTIASWMKRSIRQKFLNRQGYSRNRLLRGEQQKFFCGGITNFSRKQPLLMKCPVQDYKETSAVFLARKVTPHWCTNTALCAQ